MVAVRLARLASLNSVTPPWMCCWRSCRWCVLTLRNSRCGVCRRCWCWCWLWRFLRGWSRQVEAKIFELQEAMADRGYTDAEIEEKVRAHMNVGNCRVSPVCRNSCPIKFSPRLLCINESSPCFNRDPNHSCILLGVGGTATSFVQFRLQL